MTVFLAAFGGAFLAILKVFLIIAAAGLLVRRGVLGQGAVTGLSDVTVVLFLPCLIFGNVVTTLDPRAFPLWWAMPLAGILMAAVGLAVAALAFSRELPAKSDMLAVASMQNAGYLVLPVGLALYPADFDRFALYCFLFILGFNAVLWSVGKALSTGSVRAGGWKGLITPPLVANLAATVLALFGAGRLLPNVVVDGIELVGQAAVPSATVVLGAVLGSVAFQLRPHLWDASRALAIKLGILPLLTVVAVRTLGLEQADPLLARFFVLEAASAPAVGIILQVRTYGGDEKKVGSVMLVAYAACVLTLPAWLAAWEALIR
ncbi:MAG TPA: AEC family transporter [Thermoanaerobaculales bacterium]|nr:AEC family transporter [Thermoanaerobaculales bacterium]